MRRKWTVATFVICCLGWIWVFSHVENHQNTTLCYMQWLFHFPCPTCGITRSIIALTKGNISLSFYEHPLGIPAAIAMVIFPLWIISDWMQRRASFEQFTLSFFNTLQKKKYMVPFAGIFLCCWIWNIYKHLC